MFSRLLCGLCPTEGDVWILSDEGASILISSFSFAPEVVMGIGDRGIMLLKPSKEESEEWQKVRQGFGKLSMQLITLAQRSNILCSEISPYY